MRVAVGRNGLPQCPTSIADEVELYAREYGRHAKVHFVPYGGWFARLTLRPNDKRMLLYQQGVAAEPPSEDVWFHIPNPYAGQDADIRATELGKEFPLIGEMCYGMKRQGDWLPLDIVQMGPSGVRRFLERGNTWGRGEIRDITENLRRTREAVRKEKMRFKDNLRTEARHESMDKRRSLLKIPFLPVGINLKRTTKEE